MLTGIEETDGRMVEGEVAGRVVALGRTFCEEKHWERLNPHWPQGAFAVRMEPLLTWPAARFPLSPS